MPPMLICIFLLFLVASHSLCVFYWIGTCYIPSICREPYTWIITNLIATVSRSFASNFVIIVDSPISDHTISIGARSLTFTQLMFIVNDHLCVFIIPCVTQYESVRSYLAIIELFCVVRMASFFSIHMCTHHNFDVPKISLLRKYHMVHMGQSISCAIQSVFLYI